MTRDEYLSKLKALLVEVVGEFDVVDGQDGTPSPNWAMQAASTLEAAIEEAES